MNNSKMVPNADMRAQSARPSEQNADVSEPNRDPPELNLEVPGSNWEWITNINTTEKECNIDFLK